MGNGNDTKGSNKGVSLTFRLMGEMFEAIKCRKQIHSLYTDCVLFDKIVLIFPLPSLKKKKKTTKHTLRRSP